MSRAPAKPAARIAPGASTTPRIDARIDTATLLRLAGAWIATNLSATYGERISCIEIDVRRGEVRTVNRADDDDPPADPVETHPLDFPYTPTQAEILLALRRGDMRADALAAACRVDKARLYERGRGIDQLRAAALVGHQERMGYFLTELGERLAELIAKEREDGSPTPR